MFYSKCLSRGFRCKENITKDENIANKKFIAVKKERTNLRRQLTNLEKSEKDLKSGLWDSEHYRFIYKDLPAPHEIKSEKPQNVRIKIKNQFGETATQYVTDDPNKVTLSVTGVNNWRIPQVVFMKLLDKHPIKIWNQTKGYSDNAVIRFVGEINISLFWNCCIYAVKTKTRWVVMFWPTENDDFLYADPITKAIWKPIPSKDEDNPEVIIS